MVVDAKMRVHDCNRRFFELFAISVSRISLPCPMDQMWQAMVADGAFDPANDAAAGKASSSPFCNFDSQEFELSMPDARTLQVVIEPLAAGGFVDINTGAPQDANALPIAKENAELSMDAAACIGCGACVASCTNASAMLFVGAKISQLSLLPQGQAEAEERVINMVAKMDELGFGNCTNEAECEASCPKGIDISNIARMNREFLSSAIKSNH